MPLSKTDWTEAALLALARDGLAGVAVEPLARRLGATKGSFYWHFADRAALIAATLELYEQRETTEVIDRIQAIPDPRERLTAIASDAYAGAATPNAHAGVLAAAADPRVAPVLTRITRTRLAYIEWLYTDLGLAPDLATRQARLAYALYLGISQLRRADPDHEPTGTALNAYLDLAVDVMMPPDRGRRTHQ
ncbi:MAG: TetR/AcrR family transcriptional regulator [Actinomycetota bacterium]|nr:TetR/AcrR family transcriptional regulator [Actinomycetota bacterium]